MDSSIAARISQLVKTLIEKKPRNYLKILEAYKRLLRLEVEKRQRDDRERDRAGSRRLGADRAELEAKIRKRSDDEFRRESGAARRHAHPRRAATFGTAACATASNASSSNFNLTLIMSTILEEIETQIAGLKTSTTKSNVGVVRETGDGVARIEGLSDVMLNEMIEFSSGVFGLALNLEETEVGAIILGDTTKVMEGDEVKTTGRLLSVPVGKALARSRGEHDRRAARWQRADQGGSFLSAGKNRAGRHQAKERQSAGADRHHGDRRDDSDRSRPARVDHRRSRHGQIDDRDRYDHQPGATEQGRRSREDEGFPPALLHLRRDRAEEFQRGARARGSRKRRRHALHDDHFRARLRHGREPISRAVRRRGDGRVVHG